MWEGLIEKGGPNNVSPNLLRELGIYGGAQGIWVDKQTTQLNTAISTGVTVALLHTGEYYSDELSDIGITYHFPKTNRPPSRDLGEIQATKEAHNLSLPVFVISLPYPRAPVRNVKLGWIESWDDETGVFYITFIKEEPNAILYQPQDKETFSIKEEETDTTAVVKTRPEQQRFSFLVFQRYGEQCAVCDIEITALLDAAHLVPKKENGTDDPRNGIVLCVLHHRALDAGLFCIDPNSLHIALKKNGPSAQDLRITKDSIAHLRELPHRDALSWRWERWTD